MYKYYLIILILILLIIVNKSFENFNSPTNNCNYIDYQLAKRYFYNNRECKKLTTKANCNNQDRCVWAANIYNNNTQECIDIDSNNLDTDYNTIIDCNKLNGKIKKYLTNNDYNINEKICNLSEKCYYNEQNTNNGKCLDCSNIVDNILNTNFQFDEYNNDESFKHYDGDKNVYLTSNNDNSVNLHGEKILNEPNKTCSIDYFNDNDKDKKPDLKDSEIKCYVHLNNDVCEMINKKHKYYIYRTSVFDNLEKVFITNNDNDIKKQIYWKNMMYYDLLKTKKDDYINYNDFIAINPNNNEYLYYIFKDKPVYADLTNCKITPTNTNTNTQNIFSYLKRLDITNNNSQSTPTTQITSTSNEPENILITMEDFIDYLSNNIDNNDLSNNIDSIRNLFKEQSNNELNSDVIAWGSDSANGTILQRTGEYIILNNVMTSSSQPNQLQQAPTTTTTNNFMTSSSQQPQQLQQPQQVSTTTNNMIVI